MPYTRLVAEAAARALRNDTRGLLRRVENGERVTIMVDGRPVAVLLPVDSRARWISREDFVARILTRQADPALTQDLAQLAGETTDMLPL